MTSIKKRFPLHKYAFKRIAGYTGLKPKSILIDKFGIIFVMTVYKYGKAVKFDSSDPITPMNHNKTSTLCYHLIKFINNNQY